jgi:alkaline phosphatase D
VIPSREGDLLSTPVATEFVTTSISSGGDGSDIPATWENVLTENPHTHLLSDRRGYQVFNVSHNAWQTEVVAIDKVTAAGGSKSVIARLVTEHGKPGIEKA